MKKLLLSLVLTIGFASPAVAEEVVQEEVGGWAVVNPETNQVHGVIVCTESVCGSNGAWAGVLPGEYMGCTNCSLKFQTKATDDEFKTKPVNSQTAVVETVKEDSKDVVVPVKVQYEQWNGGTSFFYGSVEEFESNVDADVESVFTPCDTCNADPEQVEEYRNAFYETVTALTSKVKSFISSLFGGMVI